MSIQTINELMEEASQALVEVNYITCEKKCLQALNLAFEIKAFDVYARILLPLQEARRQRRQLAEDAGVFILNGEKLPASSILKAHPTGCLMLTTPPYSEQDTTELQKLAFEDGYMVEILLVDPEQLKAMFLNQLELNGDTALVNLPEELAGEDLIKALQDVVKKVGDHEIAHQRLAQAAHQLAAKRARSKG